MSRPIGHDVTAQVAAEQQQIADDIEYLVPGWLVGKAQLVVDEAVIPEDKQVGCGRAGAQALPAELGRFGFQDEGAARRYFRGKAFRRDGLCVHLPGDGRSFAVVKDIADPELVPLSWVQRQGRAMARDDDRRI